jgi:hypothetical protein
LRRLRLRAERLGGQAWDEDLQHLVEDEAEQACTSAAELITAHIETPLDRREAERAEALRVRARGLPNSDEIEDCITHGMWSRAEHLIEHPERTPPGRRPIPPLAILGYSPAWVQRLVTSRSRPPAGRDTWRDLDDGTVDLVRLAGERDDPATLARVASKLNLTYLEDGTTLTLSGFGADLGGEGGFPGFDTTTVEGGKVPAERLLRVALSRGDRRAQLLRVILHGRPTTEVFDRVGTHEQDLAARLAITLQLATATTGDDVAAAVCHEAGHHPHLARILLSVLQPNANVDRALTVADVERARLDFSTVEQFAAVLDEIGAAHPLAMRALRVAAADAVDRADSDLLELLVDDVASAELHAALLASGLARHGADDEVLLGIEPFQLIAVQHDGGY